MSKKIKAFLHQQAGNLVTAIRELNDEELQEALKIAKEYSHTNCWWAEYQMKLAFINLIESRIDDIKALHKLHEKKP
jgi:hypothetical protein